MSGPRPSGRYPPDAPDPRYHPGLPMPPAHGIPPRPDFFPPNQQQYNSPRPNFPPPSLPAPPGRYSPAVGPGSGSRAYDERFAPNNAFPPGYGSPGPQGLPLPPKMSYPPREPIPLPRPPLPIDDRMPPPPMRSGSGGGAATPGGAGWQQQGGRVHDERWDYHGGPPPPGGFAGLPPHPGHMGVPQRPPPPSSSAQFPLPPHPGAAAAYPPPRASYPECVRSRQCRSRRADSRTLAATATALERPPRPVPTALTRRPAPTRDPTSALLPPLATAAPLPTTPAPRAATAPLPRPTELASANASGTTTTDTRMSVTANTGLTTADLVRAPAPARPSPVHPPRRQDDAVAARRARRPASRVRLNRLAFVELLQTRKQVFGDEGGVHRGRRAGAVIATEGTGRRGRRRGIGGNGRASGDIAMRRRIEAVDAGSTVPSLSGEVAGTSGGGARTSDRTSGLRSGTTRRQRRLRLGQVTRSRLCMPMGLAASIRRQYRRTAHTSGPRILRQTPSRPVIAP